MAGIHRALIAGIVPKEAASADVVVSTLTAVARAGSLARIVLARIACILRCRVAVVRGAGSVAWTRVVAAPLRPRDVQEATSEYAQRPKSDG